MDIIIEHPDTGETRILRPGPDGHYPNFMSPWRVKPIVQPVPVIIDQAPRIQTQILDAQEQEKRRAAWFANIDNKLTKIAAMLSVPVADIFKTVGNALGLDCAACELRYQIWQKAQQMGWRKVFWLTWQSVRAQVKHDEATIEAMAKEIEDAEILNAGS